MRAANKAMGKQPIIDERGRRKNAAVRARRLAEKQADAMPVVEAVGPRQLRVVDAELVDPAPRGGIREVLQQGYLLKLIVGRELAQMYAASMLGLLWSYVQPAIRFATYYAVFGVILDVHRGTPYFALHLFTGMVFVHLFSETWSGGTRSIWMNRALVMKMRLPKELFPVAAFIVALYHTVPQILVLLIFCFASGWHLTWGACAAFLLGLAIIFCFGMALALFFAAFNVFFRDFQNIVTTVLTFIHFLVPMMYAFNQVWELKASQGWLYQVYMANPLAEGVLLMQKFFWYAVIPFDQRTPDGLIADQGGGNRVTQIAFPPDLWERGLIMLVICAALLFVAQKYFTRVENRFPELL